MFYSQTALVVSRRLKSVKLGSVTLIIWFLQFFVQRLWNSHLKPLNTKVISVSKFQKKNFWLELDQTLIKGETDESEDPYSKLTQSFSKVLHQHPPLKSKQIRGN